MSRKFLFGDSKKKVIIGVIGLIAITFLVLGFYFIYKFLQQYELLNGSGNVSYLTQLNDNTYFIIGNDSKLYTSKDLKTLTVVQGPPGEAPRQILQSLDNAYLLCLTTAGNLYYTTSLSTPTWTLSPLSTGLSFVSQYTFNNINVYICISNTPGPSSSYIYTRLDITSGQWAYLENPLGSGLIPKSIYFVSNNNNSVQFPVLVTTVGKAYVPKGYDTNKQGYMNFSTGGWVDIGGTTTTGINEYLLYPKTNIDNYVFSVLSNGNVEYTNTKDTLYGQPKWSKTTFPAGVLAKHLLLDNNNKFLMVTTKGNVYKVKFFYF